MKRISKVALISSLCFISSSFAHNLADLIKCPSLPHIVNTQFTKAFASASNPDVWILVSDEFSYESKKWNLTYSVLLPSAKSSQEAIELGQLNFKQYEHEWKLSSGKSDSYTYCKYTPFRPPYGSNVIAFSPPQYFW